jgi:hypothetical protein
MFRTCPEQVGTTFQEVFGRTRKARNEKKVRVNGKKEIVRKRRKTKGRDRKERRKLLMLL